MTMAGGEGNDYNLYPIQPPVILTFLDGLLKIKNPRFFKSPSFFAKKSRTKQADGNHLEIRTVNSHGNHRIVAAAQLAKKLRF